MQVKSQCWRVRILVRIVKTQQKQEVTLLTHMEPVE